MKEDDDERAEQRGNAAYIYKIENIILFLIGIGVNHLNFLLFKFLNIFFISNIFLYDSLFNLNFLNYSFSSNKKILIGKKFNQISIFKKCLYSKYFICFKKYHIISRLKSGDLNFFSRINNELVYIISLKLFFIIFSSYTSCFNSFNILNYFLTQRFNLSNIIFMIYLNSINIFKSLNCFLNKTIIYYMINNNIDFLFDCLKDFEFYYLFFLESSSFYTEHLYYFNYYDVYLSILENFIIFKFPKYIIINNFLNSINIVNFFIII